MNGSKKLPFTKDELKWARKAAKKLGIKDPEAFLEMRWSEVTKLCREKGLDWAITPAPVAPKKKPRRASASRPKKPSSTSSSGTSRSKA